MLRASGIRILIDAIVLKVRSGQVSNRPVYVAVGITVEGHRDVLGMWVVVGPQVPGVDVMC